MTPELNKTYFYKPQNKPLRRVVVTAIKNNELVTVKTEGTTGPAYSARIEKLREVETTEAETPDTGEATTAPPPVANPFPVAVADPKPADAPKASKTGAKTMFKRIESDFCRPHAEIHGKHETLTGERLIRVPMTPEEGSPVIVTCPELLGDVLANLTLSWKLADVEADWLEPFQELVIEPEEGEELDEEEEDQGDDAEEDDEAWDKITKSVGQSGTGPRKNVVTVPTAGKTIPGKLSARASKHARTWAVGEKRRKADGSLILADGNGKLPKDVLRDWYAAHPEMKDEILTWQ